MNINYEKRNNEYSNKIILDASKSNILILGKASNYNERCVVINPMNADNAYKLYGDSELSRAYKLAQSITKDINIYTVNCRTYDDFKTTAEKTLHYNFNFFIPIGLNLEDKFFNVPTKKDEYYFNYFLFLVEQYNSITTIISTGNNSKDYLDIDSYLKYSTDSIDKYFKESLLNNDDKTLLTKNASDLIYILNNLKDIEYANVILGAQLANKQYTTYPVEQSYNTIFDIDKRDMQNDNIVYHKYNYLTEKVSIENLINMRLEPDIYKNVLVDSVIKDTIREISLDEYRGKLYNAYVKIQIENKAKKKLNSLVGKFFKSYELIDVGFVKTEQTAGYIYIELSITPYGFMESISMVLEV